MSKPDQKIERSSRNLRERGAGGRAVVPGVVAGALILVGPAFLAPGPPPSGLPQSDVINIESAPDGLQLDGRVREWEARAPTLTLMPHSPDARRGRIWLGQSDAGLIVAGTLDGAPPSWPGSPAELATSDHVALWLAPADSLVLPPIGWGNQFGELVLAGEEDCAPERPATGGKVRATEEACREWFRAQEAYRSEFRKLFVRQWRAAPGTVVEAYALPAYESFDDSTRRALQPLAPRGRPEFWAEEGRTEGRAYDFEVLVSWDDFPPLGRLDLSALRVRVDVVGSGTRGFESGPLSTTSPAPLDGGAETLVRGELAVPRLYSLTPCGYELRGLAPAALRYVGFGRLLEDQLRPARFLPRAEVILDSVITLHNPARGYAYEPYGNSPAASWTGYFARRLPNGGTVCGPRLRYLTSTGRVATSEATIRPDFALRPLPGGGVLLRNGPEAFSTYYGSGQCGACPRIGLSIYHLDQMGRARALFEWVGIAEPEFRDVDVTVSERWDTISIFKSRPTEDYEDQVWSVELFCHAAAEGVYELCEKRDSVPAPSPRHVRYPF